MNRFGTLKDSDIFERTTEEQYDFLVQQGYATYESYFPWKENLGLSEILNENGEVVIDLPTNTTIKSVKKKTRLLFSEDLLQEFYSYLLKSWKKDILEVKIEFFNLIGLTKIGMEDVKGQREHYKAIFDSMYSDLKNNVPVEISFREDRANFIRVEDVFGRLRKCRRTLVIRPRYNYELLLNYLAGNSKDILDIIKKEGAKEEVVEFEGRLTILLELNREFGFFTNDYFTGFPEMDHDFNQLVPDLFLERNSLYFIISSIDKFGMSSFTVRSIFHILLEKNWIVKQRNQKFMDFLRRHFEIGYKNNDLRKIGYKGYRASEQKKYLEFCHFFDGLFAFSEG